MNLIKILFFLSIFFTFSFSKGEVSKIFAHTENAPDTTYTVNGQEYRWGRGKNLVIDGFEYNNHHYNYVSDSPLVKVVRVDNNHASGEPCALFAEKKGNGNGVRRYRLEPSLPQGCDMAKIMAGRTINIGALDIFKNIGSGNGIDDTAKNIERVDFISPNGIFAPSKNSDLEKAGHVVTEKSGNNEIKIAAILTIDGNNNPTSYGTLVSVHDADNNDNSNIDYATQSITVSNGPNVGSFKFGFYRNEQIGVQGNPWYLGSTSEQMGMAFVTLADLGVSAGQKYYGFSYFARDVTSVMDLTNPSSFPSNTSGDTADSHGGVASYFVDEEISYDFGDAPNSYPHVSHKISSNLYLGTTTPDGEDTQQSSNDASGDGADDSDGVITLPILTLGDNSYTVPVKVFNNTDENAYITAWIDFNRNGKFEFNEALNVNDLSIPSSTSSQNINVVWDNSFSNDQFANLTTGTNIMRIRLTTSRILRCDSEHYSDGGSYAGNYFVSPDGEVEDYEITIEPILNPGIRVDDNSSI
jgi:hypothetical protein